MKGLANYGVQNFSDTTAGVVAVQLMAREWYGAEDSLDREVLQEPLIDPFGKVFRLLVRILANTYKHHLWKTFL